MNNENVELTPITISKRKQRNSVFKSNNINGLKTQYLNVANSLKVNLDNKFYESIKSKLDELVKIQEYIVENIKTLNLGNTNNNINSVKNNFTNFESEINNANTIIGLLVKLQEKKADYLKLCFDNNKIIDKQIIDIQTKFRLSNDPLPSNKEIMSTIIRPFKNTKIANEKIINRLKEIDISETLDNYGKQNYVTIYKNKLYKLVLQKYQVKITENKKNINVKLVNFNKKNINDKIKILIECKKIFKNASIKINKLTEIFNTKINSKNNVIRFQTDLNSLVKIIEDCKALIATNIEKLRNNVITSINKAKKDIKEKIEELIKNIKNCISNIRAQKNPSLEPFKKELASLKDEFKKTGKELNINFNNILKENENVVELEKRLNTILSNIENLFNKNVINKNNKKVILAPPFGVETVEAVKNEYRNIENSNRNSSTTAIKNGSKISWKSPRGEEHFGTISSHELKSGTQFYTILNAKNNKGTQVGTFGKVTIVNKPEHKLNIKIKK